MTGRASGLNSTVTTSSEKYIFLVTGLTWINWKMDQLNKNRLCECMLCIYSSTEMICSDAVNICELLCALPVVGTL